MKIKRVVNDVEMEFELTHDEVAEAYLEHEHYYDCESVRGDLNSGCYEEFEGLSDEEWENAVHEIAREARYQMEEYGYDEWVARDIARKCFIREHKRGDRETDVGMKITDEIKDGAGMIYEVRLEPNRFILVESNEAGVVGIFGDMPERSAPLVYDKEDRFYPNFEYDSRAVEEFALEHIKAEAQKNVDTILNGAQERSEAEPVRGSERGKRDLELGKE